MPGDVLQIEVNKKNYVFRLEKNLSEPCAHCGVPACGKEYYVFAAGNDEQEAIGFDGGLFEIICEDFIRVNIDQTPYNELPVFLRQYNESAGWNTFLEDEVKINGDELLQALAELRKATLAEWLMKDCKMYCDTLSAFITAQTKNKRDLFLLKT